MSDLIAAHADAPDGVLDGPQHVIDTNEPAPILITEREVVLSTAAAAALTPTKPTHGVIAAVRAMFARTPADARPVPPSVPRHYPPRRPAFLEDAAMARAMRTL